MTDEPVTVLVLDDDPAAIRFVRDALEAPSSDGASGAPGDCTSGVELYHARILEECLDRWDGIIDAVVTDLELPDSTGIATVEALAAVNHD